MILLASLRSSLLVSAVEAAATMMTAASAVRMVLSCMVFERSEEEGFELLCGGGM